MKRYLTLCFILIMAVSLCACGQKGAEPLPETSGAPSASASKTETGASSNQTDTGDQESTFDTLAADYETILSNIKFKAQ